MSEPIESVSEKKTASRPFDISKSWAGALPSLTEPAQSAAGTEPTPPVPQPSPSPEQPAAPSKPAPVQAKEEPDKESDEKWPRSAQEWKNKRKLHAEALEQRDKRIKEVETEMAQWREKFEKTSSVPDKSPELEAITKERDELSDRLRITAVEKHPRFESYFKNKTDAQIDLARRIVGADKADSIARILTIQDAELRDREIENLIVEMPQLVQTRIGSVLNALDEINRERQGEIGKAREHYEKIQAEEKANYESRRKNLEKMFDDAVSQAQGKDGVPMFQNRDGDEAWNNDVKDRIEAARNLLFGNNVNPKQAVQAMLNAMAYKPLLSALQFVTADNAKLKTQVQELTKATPKLGEEGKETVEEGTRPQVNAKSGSRPMDVAASFMKGLPSIK